RPRSSGTGTRGSARARAPPRRTPRTRGARAGSACRGGAVDPRGGWPRTLRAPASGAARSRSGSPSAPPERPSVHLAQVGARERVDEHDLPRMLVRVEAFSHVRLEGLLEAVLRALGHDVGARLHEPLGV